jgi:Spy/CpxP family protein refolding chaperone
MMMTTKQINNLIAAFNVSVVLAYSASVSATPINLESPKPEHFIQLAMMDGMGMDGMGASKSGMSMPSDSMPANDTQGSMSDSPPSGMDMMGKMRGRMSGQHGMNKKMPTSNLPGFPGASHLYHIGATGFFLDHPQHITLSANQQKNLNRIREKAMLDQTNADRRIEDAEQELWVLTSMDTPDAAKIEAKIQVIEKLRSTQRMNFIKAVGEAAKVLTPEQRNALVGMGTAPTAQPPAQAAPMSDM